MGIFCDLVIQQFFQGDHCTWVVDIGGQARTKISWSEKTKARGREKGRQMIKGSDEKEWLNLRNQEEKQTIKASE